MENHELQQLETIVRQSLIKSRSLPLDQRISKAGLAGVRYLAANKLEAPVLNLVLESGKYTTLRGTQAAAYLMAGMAKELINEENIVTK